MKRTINRKRSVRLIIIQIIFSLTAIMIIKNLGSTFLFEPEEVITVVGIYDAPQAETPVAIDLKREAADIFLQLVNTDYAVGNSAYSSVLAYGTVPVLNSGIELNETVLAALKKMFCEAAKDGYTDFYISDGKRTYDEQKRLYNEGNVSLTQEPNHSEHQTGLAVDISSNKGGMDICGKWLRKNAHLYGFVLRYPADKTDITGIKYEPWHFRYIGLPHAYYCYENKICLEEYISFLKKNGGYFANINGLRYNVYYADGESSTAFIPKNADYTVSDDNTGGFIITCTERD